MNHKEAQQYIVFHLLGKDMKLVDSHPVSGSSCLTLTFCKQTNTWKLVDETDSPLHRLFCAVKLLLQTEKRFEGSAGTLAQKLTALDHSLDYAPNALTRIFNRHSISMEYEYGICYQQKKRTSGAREFVLTLQK